MSFWNKNYILVKTDRIGKLPPSVLRKRERGDIRTHTPGSLQEHRSGSQLTEAVRGKRPWRKLPIPHMRYSGRRHKVKRE